MDSRQLYEDLVRRVEYLEKELEETRNIAWGSFYNLKSDSCVMGYKMNMLSPKTFNSKVNWLSINYWDLHPARYYINDKYFFKYYMSKMFNDKYKTPKTLACYENIDKMDFDALSDSFVLKKTLGGGAHEVLLIDKNKDDVNKVKIELQKWLKTGCKARVLAEEMLEFEGDYIYDYKFFVSRGKAFLCMVASMNKKEGAKSRTFQWYDRNRNRCRVSSKDSLEIFDIPKAEVWSQMIEISEDIGMHFPFVRVDLYFSRGEIYVGELTGLPFNGFSPFDLKYDFGFGKNIDLPSKEEIEKDFKEIYETFPELVLSPIFLKGKNPDYRIIQPCKKNVILPKPPENFIQPM